MSDIVWQEQRGDIGQHQQTNHLAQPPEKPIDFQQDIRPDKTPCTCTKSISLLWINQSIFCVWHRYSNKSVYDAGVYVWLCAFMHACKLCMFVRTCMYLCMDYIHHIYIYIYMPVSYMVVHHPIIHPVCCATTYIGYVYPSGSFISYAWSHTCIKLCTIIVCRDTYIYLISALG